MKTQYLTVTEMAQLAAKLRQGDEKAINYVVSEIGRLQSVIRDLEIGMECVVIKYNSTVFKEPTQID